MQRTLPVFGLPIILLAGCATLNTPESAPLSIEVSGCATPPTPQVEIIASSRPALASLGHAKQRNDEDFAGGAIDQNSGGNFQDVSELDRDAGVIRDPTLADQLACSLSAMTAQAERYRDYAQSVREDRRNIGAGMLATAFTGVAFEVFDAHPDNSAAAALGLGGLTVVNNSLNQSEIVVVLSDSRESYECFRSAAIPVQRALEAGTRDTLRVRRNALIDAIAMAQRRLASSGDPESADLRAEVRATIDAAEILLAEASTAYSAITNFPDDFATSWRAADGATQRRLHDLGPDFAAMIESIQALQTSSDGPPPGEGNPGAESTDPEGFTAADLENSLTGLRVAMRLIRPLLEFNYAANRSQLAVCQAKAAG